MSKRNSILPKMLGNVLKAVAELREQKGSTVKKIVEHVQTKINNSKTRPKPRNVVMQVKKAIKHAVTAGVLMHKGGKFRLAVPHTSAAGGRRRSSRRSKRRKRKNRRRDSTSPTEASSTTGVTSPGSSADGSVTEVSLRETGSEVDCAKHSSSRRKKHRKRKQKRRRRGSDEEPEGDDTNEEIGGDQPPVPDKPNEEAAQKPKLGKSRRMRRMYSRDDYDNDDPYNGEQMGNDCDEMDCLCNTQQGNDVMDGNYEYDMADQDGYIN